MSGPTARRAPVPGRLPSPWPSPGGRGRPLPGLVAFARGALPAAVVRMCPLVRLALPLALGLGHSTLLAQPLPGGRLGDASLREVPEVVLDGVEPAVREQLEGARRRLAELRRESAPPAALGDAYAALGQLYLLYDLVEPAAASLENALRLSPDDFRSVYLLGTLHQHEGRMEKAADAYGRALELRPADLAARLRLAEVRLDQERLADARALFEGALDDGSGAAYAHYGLGRIAWAEGRSRDALDHFGRALELQPQATALYYHLALAQRALGQREAAQESLARRGEVEVRFPDPVALEVQRRATGAGALLVLGRISRDEGHLEEAERRFREAVRMAPDNVAARRALASILEQQGRREEALAEHLESLRLEPADPAREHRVGLLLGAEGRDEEAVEHLERAVRLAPDYTPAWVDLAHALVRVDREADALEALRQIQEPLSAEQRELEAVLLESLERADEARAVLEELLRDEPERATAALRLARLEAAAGELERARQRFRSLAGRDLEPALAANVEFHLGNLTAESAPQEAIEHFRRSVALDPGEPEAHFNLATLLARRGRYAEAAEAYRAVLELDPEHPTAGVARGMALVLAERYGEARSHLEATLEAQPSNVGAAHLLARLLAAAPEEQARDGELALALASKVFEAVPSTDHGETVAMALAELGRFDEAVEWQRRLVAELAAGGYETLLSEARARLELYERREAVRSPWR